jgi:hypothetical protein
MTFSRQFRAIRGNGFGYFCGFPSASFCLGLRPAATALLHNCSTAWGPNRAVWERDRSLVERVSGASSPGKLAGSSAGAPELSYFTDQMEWFEETPDWVTCPR